MYSRTENYDSSTIVFCNRDHFVFKLSFIIKLKYKMKIKLTLQDKCNKHCRCVPLENSNPSRQLPTPGSPAQMSSWSAQHGH